MEENLHILKEIGAQKIHKDTHISKEFVQAIIHGSFDGLSSVQLNGFISILEREYDVDLSDLKRKAKEHFNDTEATTIDGRKVFVTPEKQESNSKTYIFLGLVVFIAAVYFSFINFNETQMQTSEVDDTKIQNAQNSMKELGEVKDTVVVKDENKTDEVKVAEAVVNVVEDSNETKEEAPEVKVTEPVAKEVTEQENTLKILPKNKVWAGYINILTNQKYQKIFRKEFAIDVTKDWLLLFGSGTIYLEINGEKKKFASSRNMRFKYVDGVFSKITVEEFKSLNKGRKW